MLTKGLCKRALGVDVSMLLGCPVKCTRNILNQNIVTVAAVACYVGQRHPEEKDLERTSHKLEGLTLVFVLLCSN